MQIYDRKNAFGRAWKAVFDINCFTEKLCVEASCEQTVIRFLKKTALTAGRKLKTRGRKIYFLNFVP